MPVHTPSSLSPSTELLTRNGPEQTGWRPPGTVAVCVQTERGAHRQVLGGGDEVKSVATGGPAEGKRTRAQVRRSPEAVPQVLEKEDRAR